jgi:cell wall-associated NlpC family hydrolase
MGKWLLFVVMSLISCAGTRSITSSSLVERGVRKKIVSDATKYLGTRYKYGGMDHRGLDCSGLVFTVYKKLGVNLPRSSSAQASYGKHTSLEKAQIGDLVFFKQKGRINHVAIITKKDRNEIWVTHSTTSRGVIQENLGTSDYWAGKVSGIRDVVMAPR